jgi:hypothetical protein
MSVTPPGSLSSADAARGAADVDALLASLDHPHIAAIQALRAIIRAVDPRISESIKWNAPSFATTEHFATFHLRAKSGVLVVLHCGARARPGTALRAGIDDPEGLLEWRGPDRATVMFADEADVTARRAAFTAVIRQWIGFILKLPALHRARCQSTWCRGRPGRTHRSRARGGRRSPRAISSSSRPQSSRAVAGARRIP